MAFLKKTQTSKPNCPKCGLDKGCISPRMRYTGEGNKGILIIAEAPGEEEDKKGSQLIGMAGVRLRRELSKLGVDLEKDCFKTNSVNCRPTETTLNSTHISCCQPYVKGVLKETKPTKIFLMGNTALESFYGGRTKHMSSVGKTHGMKFWDAHYNAWVFPLWHPAYMERNEKDDLMQAEWLRCLKRAVQADSAPLQKVWNKLNLLLDFESAIAALKNCLRNDKVIAIDYETTGLDLYKDGHKTASFAWANDHGSWAVAVEHPSWTPPQQKQIKGLIARILKKPSIGKVVHSITFEWQWTKEQFGVEPVNFFWDTQLATHVLDNRLGIIGLKFQAFRRWGIGDYDSAAHSYIRTDQTTGFNKMMQMPVEQLLEYNAYDTLYTYEMYKEQRQEFVGRELEAYEFLHQGALVLCEMSYNGIPINEEYYLRQRATLEAERDELIKVVLNSEEVRMYGKLFGSFNYDSPQDISKMLFRVLKIKPTKETSASKEGKRTYSVDEEVLKKIDIPITNNVLKIRKLNKMISTYVDGFLNKTHKGKMHPYFSLSRARSFRGSSQSPNFQNIPKRDERAKKITRAGMVPRPGCCLVEMDFSGAEIVTSIYYHKDKNFIKYQTDGNADMHKDAAANILMIKPEDVPKPVRQATKGIWTFSQFYGSYYANCAKQGWEEYPLCNQGGELCTIKGVPIDEHMHNTFKNYKMFESHLKAFENTFWYKWFPHYTKWKKDVVKNYKRTGYVETLLGFRFKGYMNSKQCANYPIQGTSFHLLLNSAIKSSKEIKRRGLETLLIGQIHDSLILNVPIDEIDEVSNLLTDIVTNLHKQFDWMIVPMDLDLESSDPCEQGGSFAKMNDIKFEEAA